MAGKDFERPPNFEAIIKGQKDDKIDWHVYCTVCNKIIDHAANGKMMEAAGKIHTNTTGHSVVVGLLMVLAEKE